MYKKNTKLLADIFLVKYLMYLIVIRRGGGGIQSEEKLGVSSPYEAQRTRETGQVIPIYSCSLRAVHTVSTGTDLLNKCVFSLDQYNHN